MEKVNIKDMSREEWLTLRKKGIGGSDSAAIMGLNKYMTPFDVWADKTGRRPDQPTTDAMHFGTVLEDVVAQEYMRRTGDKVERMNFMQFHDNGVMLANIDRRIVGKKWLLECKTAGLRTAHLWGEEGTDQVPDAYFIQVQHYLSVMGYEGAKVAVLIGGQEFRIYTIKRDDDVIAEIEKSCLQFWHDYVEKDTPPPTGMTPQQATWLHGLKPKLDVVVNPDAADIVANIKKVQSAIKGLKKEEETLKGKLCDLIGEAEAVAASEGSKPLATWKLQVSNRFDSRAFKAEHPDLAQKYTKASSSRVLRLK